MKYFRWMLSFVKKKKKKTQRKKRELLSEEKKRLWAELGKKKKTFRSPQQAFCEWFKVESKREKEAVQPRTRPLVLQIQGSCILLSEVEARRTLPESPTSHPPLTQAALSLSQTRQSLNSLLWQWLHFAANKENSFEPKLRTQDFSVVWKWGQDCASEWSC